MPNYSEDFHNVLEEILGIEGGYSDHEDDSGGKTNYGITKTLAREYGYNGHMRNLPRSKALEIYHKHFWLWLRLDRIILMAPRTARELFDASVNIGRRTVWRWFQRTLNVLNRNERDFEDITVDGWPGDETLSAFDKFMAFRGPDGDLVLSRAIDSFQGVHYIELPESRPKDEDFTFGWLLNRVS